MKRTSKKGDRAAPKRGRPRATHKLEKLIAYLPPGALAVTKRAAKAAGARSLSAWASWVLEREASRILRTGVIPLEVLELPSAPDPRGLVRKAVREERERGS